MNARNHQIDLFDDFPEAQLLGVQGVVEKSRIHASWTLIRTSGGVIEHDTHFEVGGCKVSKENLWEPTLGYKEIDVNNWKMYIPTIAQAWSRKIDGIWYWYYNDEGAIRETKHRWLYLPSSIKLARMIDSIKWSNIEKANALNIPFAGHLVEGRSCPSDLDRVAYLWTDSPHNGKNGEFAMLNWRHKNTSTSWGNRGRALAVRTFLN